MDSCRGLAALSVLMFHVALVGHLRSDAIGPLQDGLRMGVQVFFVLSGFLLYRPFVAARRSGRPVALGRYAWSRLLRIVPAYWAALTFLGIFAHLPGVISGDWWRYYFFLQVYQDQTLHQGMGVAWSLCVEATFYAILPLYAAMAARWFAKREIGALAVLACLSFAFQSAMLSSHWSGTLPGSFVWFVPGMMLAIVSVENQAWLSAIGRRGIACWTAAGLVYAAACYSGTFLSETPAQMILNGLFPVVALLVVLPAMAERGAVQRLLGTKSLLWLGSISYGVYLYHATFMSWITDHGGKSVLPSPWLSLALTTLVPTLVAAALSWYLLERPLLRLKSLRLLVAPPLRLSIARAVRPPATPAPSTNAARGE
jgi:peptidoglycan/LPS O-acetylase OafA/YrhL